MKISCILIHYHTPEPLKRAVSAIEKDVSSESLDLEIIVIDNGSREEDKAFLKALPVNLIEPGGNLGYAGGVNLGARSSSSDVFIFMNPDVEVLPGCIGALVSALTDGASAAGPRFYMDTGKEILLPPLIELSITNELLWRLSVFGEGAAKWVRNSWRKHAKEQWLAKEPIVNYNLTGAMLAVTREAWKRVGPFDEIYKLYFEEADWLKRLRMKDLKAYYVPTAEAVHMQARSTSKEGLSKKWYEESLSIYRKRYYGSIFTAFLERTVPAIRGLSGKEINDASDNSTTENPVIDLSGFDKPIWIEISSNILGLPALGVPIEQPLPDKWTFPRELWEDIESGKYYFRTVDNGGKELQNSIFVKS